MFVLLAQNLFWSGSECRPEESSSFFQIEVITNLPDCFQAWGEWMCHPNEKSTILPSNKADVDQLFTPTTCFCCCHGIKLCDSFSSPLARNSLKPVRGSTLILSVSARQKERKRLSSIPPATACLDSQTTHAASRYTWPAAQIWWSMPSWRCVD